MIWDPRALPVQERWFEDGPFVPVEFTRQSSDGRITLVVEPKAVPVRVLWAVMLPRELQTAREAVRDRECITGNNWMSRIGAWQRGEAVPQVMPQLVDWAQTHGVDAVIWTALGPKFNGEERSPTEDEVVQYLRKLTGAGRDNAEQYVRCASRQIDTAYRRRIEAELGWAPRE
ncbi:MAG: hypothetical protein ACOY5V_11570 [Pseudomonadota bacterium]